MKLSFLVMIGCGGGCKALVVAYDDNYETLQADITNLFNLADLPLLRVLWAEEAGRNCMGDPDDDNFRAVLRLTWARGSQDTIYVTGQMVVPKSGEREVRMGSV